MSEKNEIKEKVLKLLDGLKNLINDSKDIESFDYEIEGKYFGSTIKFEIKINNLPEAKNGIRISSVNS